MRIGQRSDKRRTYNFQRDEVIDHRTGVKIKGVQRVLDGDLDAVIEAGERKLAAKKEGEK